MTAAAIGRKYAKYINRADPAKFVRHHKNMGHVGKEPQKTEPGTVSDIKAERHRAKIDKRIDDVYEMAMLGAKLAIFDKEKDEDNKAKVRKDRDTRGLAACLAQCVAVVKLQYESETMMKLQERVDELTEQLANNE